MAISNLPQRARENRVLAAIPLDEFRRVLPHLELVRLPQSRVLCDIGDTIHYAYFPLSGMISLLSTTENGETLEVAMVGSEGMVGVSLALKNQAAPYKMTVQIPAEAMRINAVALKNELQQSGKLNELMLQYAHTLLVHIAQSALCARFHTVDKRLCRWLLIARDRVKSDTMQFTQEIISHMLGTPRTVVTTAACSLQDAGLIRYRRGKITILDPERLEDYACECYTIVKKEFSYSFVA